MSSEEPDDWSSPFFDRQTLGEGRNIRSRAKKERRSQLTAKQRRRTATRTVQFNFRCSQECKDRADRLADRLQCSLPDLVEMLLNHYEQTGGKNAV